MPQGQRVVSTDIESEREYKVVCSSSAITRIAAAARSDTMYLGGPHERIPYELLEPNVLSAAWRFISKNEGRISGRLEGRIEEVK